MSQYKCISNFGSSTNTTASSNPLTYCVLPTLGSQFMHGEVANTISGKDSRNCQAFMAQYCANKWDNVCEYASKNTDTAFPNTLQKCGSASQVGCKNMTSGDFLIYNAASRKYLSKMLGKGCSMSHQPFDPTNASSPIISIWENAGCGACVPVYEVDPTKIDKDPIMNKILQKPHIALDILINIYNTAKRLNKFNKLKGTKIYNFFISKNFQSYMHKRKSAQEKLNNQKCQINPLSKRNFTII